MAPDSPVGTLTSVPVATLEPPRRQDGLVLHFLKELPAWCVLTLLIGIFLTVWQLSHDDFIPRIIDGLVGAVLTSIVGQRLRPNTAQITPPTQVTADTAEIDSNETTINVDNLKNPKGE